MKGHCACQATGASSHAIARAFGHCLTAGGNDHPHDPSDLRRCVHYCTEMGIASDRLCVVMVPISTQWAALMPEWKSLTELLDEEIAENTGLAPRTYARMQDLIYPPKADR